MDPALRQRRHASRSRLGCLTCRARRKRCDCARPFCHTCERLGLSCSYQQRPQILRDRVTAERVPESASLPLQVGAVSLDDTAHRRTLLSYYMHNFVPRISVAVTPASFYTSLYIPMAFQSDGVLNALLACAALHCARYSCGPPQLAEHYDSLSQGYQMKCHAFLKERVSMSGEAFKDAYEVVAVTLLLVGLEALKATGSSKWLRQLVCVREMLVKLQTDSHGRSSWELRCLQRHYTYHDTMAIAMATVDGQTPSKTPSNTATLGRGSASGSVDEAHWPSAVADAPVAAQEEPPIFGVIPDERIDPLMGISCGLFYLISRIRNVPKTCEGCDIATTGPFHDLERQLVDWKHDELPIDTNMEVSSVLDLVALAEAYRQSGLILLYRRADRKHPLLPRLALGVLSMIGRIPKGSTVEAGLTFPLFLAGGELRDAAVIDRCRDRLSATGQRYKLENIRRASSVLEEVWSARLQGGRDNDWEEILHEKQWSINLS